MSSGQFLADTPYARFGNLAIDATVDERRTFIRKTYLHLLVAVYALVGLEFLYFETLPVRDLVMSLFSQRWGWFALMGSFVVVSWVADRWARSSTSLGMQYAGLGAYVFGFSVILCPLLWIANQYAFHAGNATYSPIAIAAVATLVVFGVLTATVFLTRADFSFLGPILGIATFVAFALVALSAF